MYMQRDPLYLEAFESCLSRQQIHNRPQKYHQLCGHTPNKRTSIACLHLYITYGSYSCILLLTDMDAKEKDTG